MLEDMRNTLKMPKHTVDIIEFLASKFKAEILIH